MCEHHTVEQELLHLTMNGYILGSNFCKKDLTPNLIILRLYRALSGDVNELQRRLDTILRYLYTPKSEFIIRGDININYLNESGHKNK
jgi:hypothetical protein